MPWLLTKEWQQAAEPAYLRRQDISSHDIDYVE